MVPEPNPVLKTYLILLTLLVIFFNDNFGQSNIFHKNTNQFALLRFYRCLITENSFYDFKQLK